MSKKEIIVRIDKELFKNLKKRAKRDYLSVNELVNLILWRSCMRSKKHGKVPVEKFVELFSRYKPYRTRKKKKRKISKKTKAKRR